MLSKSAGRLLASALQAASSSSASPLLETGLSLGKGKETKPTREIQRSSRVSPETLEFLSLPEPKLLKQAYNTLVGAVINQSDEYKHAEASQQGDIDAGPHLRHRRGRERHAAHRHQSVIPILLTMHDLAEWQRFFSPRCPVF